LSTAAAFGGDGAGAGAEGATFVTALSTVPELVNVGSPGRAPIDRVGSAVSATAANAAVIRAATLSLLDTVFPFHPVTLQTLEL
jgi:hypothetical protein